MGFAEFNMLEEKLRQYSNYAPHIMELIQPLCPAGIVGLFYFRVYSNGTIINLASDINWTEFYFKKLLDAGYQNYDIDDQCFVSPSVSLWELNPANQIWQDGKNYFGYGNGVTLCEVHPNFREVISFYSTSDNHAMNHFYINKIDILRKMKRYFLSRAAELIQHAEKERLLFQHPIFPQNNILTSLKNPELNESDTNSLIAPISVFHKHTGLPIQLSPQRSQCLFHLLQGKSTKEIARAMNLAFRTIEHYLEFIRKELGCRSSKELILSYTHQIIYTDEYQAERQ